MFIILFLPLYLVHSYYPSDLKGFFSQVSNVASYREGAVNMNLKDQFYENEKRIAITRKLMENARERIKLSSELEKELKNLELQRRMRQLEMESKLLKQQEKELG